MSLHGSLHIDSTHRIQLCASDRFDWVTIWSGATPTCGVHCDDASTAERLAEGFTELAAKMRARRGLPEPEAQDEEPTEEESPWRGGEHAAFVAEEQANIQRWLKR